MSALDDLIARAGARVVAHANLGERTTYRVGGAAAALVTVANGADLDELGPLIEATGLPVVALGHGSNLLVADGEHDVVAVQLGDGFAELSWRDVDGVVEVEAGAALDLPVAARRLASDAVVGFEWAVGVPGTFGGAVSMNAGGHGSNMAASVVRTRTWLGQARERTLADLDFGYRTSGLEPGELVTGVTLHLARGDAAAALEQVREIVRWRRAHQPGGANAGSVFRNPPDDTAGRLIDAAGLKGVRVRSAVVSSKHANFILVDRGGQANDVAQLMQLVARRVAEQFGVELVSEHRLIGFEGSG
ncbi:MAG TPA: UDP-N-acetylmuramate dehydrogenase [Acidimicrobiales bacterium]|nr:UDP-N-acetylmuramate dehydrogenase [Acidimicrobiales bacterium]